MQFFLEQKQVVAKLGVGVKKKGRIQHILQTTV